MLLVVAVDVDEMGRRVVEVAQKKPEQQAEEGCRSRGSGTKE